VDYRLGALAITPSKTTSMGSETARRHRQRSSGRRGRRDGNSWTCSLLGCVWYQNRWRATM